MNLHKPVPGSATVERVAAPLSEHPGLRGASARIPHSRLILRGTLDAPEEAAGLGHR